MSAVNIVDIAQDAPDRIGPDYSPQRTFGEHIQHITRAFTTKQGLIGTYDYGTKPHGVISEWGN